MHPKRPAQPNPQEVTLSTETVRKHYTNDLPISSLISSGQKTQRPTLSTFTILLRQKKKKGTRTFKRITKIKAVSDVIIYQRNNNHMNNCHNKQKKIISKFSILKSLNKITVPAPASMNKKSNQSTKNQMN
jgi:hypothetical protein